MKIYKNTEAGKWDLFRPDETSLKTYQIVTFDTEDNGDGLFTCGSIVDHTGKHVFFSRDDMREKLLSYREPDTRVFAHNLMYDIVNVFQPEYENMSVFFIQGRAITLKYQWGKKKKQNIIFQDSFNLFPSSLEMIGKITGELKQEISLEVLTAGLENEDETCCQIAKYCVQDSYSLYKFLTQYQEKINAKNIVMKSTIAATALNNFRRNYQDRTFKKIDPAVLETFTRSYFGGRVECYFLTERGNFIPGKFNYYDINSAYPYAMLKDLPSLNTCHYTENATLELLKKYQGVSFVEISCPEDKNYPVLPTRIGLSIYYLTGRFTGLWCHNEILYALQQGYTLHKIYFTYYFYESEPFLRQFVEDCYEEKANNKGLLREIAKGNMNNLYGKFAQVNTLDEYMTLDQYQNSKYAKTHTAQVLHDNWVRIFDDTRVFPAHSNVIWSSYITAYQRIYLHEYLEKYNALYCDTDSMITFYEMDPAETHNTDIGKWKHEKSTEKLGIYAPKCYIFGDTIHAKGVPRHAQATALETGSASFRKPIKFKEAIRRGKAGNVWEEQKKDLELNYTKRKIIYDFDADFFETKPFTWEEMRK